MSDGFGWVSPQVEEILKPDAPLHDLRWRVFERGRSQPDLLALQQTHRQWIRQSDVRCMHAAPLSSPRLQRVLALIRDRRPHSTRAIMRKASVCAVSSCIAELRQHGAEINCAKRMVGDKWRFFYTLTKGPDHG